MRAGRWPAHRWELLGGLQAPGRYKAEILDRLQDGGPCVTPLTPSSHPQSQTHPPVGWQVSGCIIFLKYLLT